MPPEAHTFDWQQLLTLLAPMVSYLTAYFIHRAPKSPGAK